MKSIEYITQTFLGNGEANTEQALPQDSTPIFTVLAMLPYIQMMLFVSGIRQSYLLPNDEDTDQEEEKITDNTPKAFNNLHRWFDLVCDFNMKFLANTLNKATDTPQHNHTTSNPFGLLLNHSIPEDSGVTERILSNHHKFMINHLELSKTFFQRLGGINNPPVIKPCKTDHRFDDSEWESNPIFDYIKQFYLLNSQAAMTAMESADIPPQNKALLSYYVRQFTSALSPSNFALINPEVLRKTQETHGENIFLGIKQFIKDQSKSTRLLNIRMSDNEHFQLGENIGTANGKVIFENELMQLIQYQATTSKTHAIPLLMIPSWINKYYILDLSPANSFVQWAVNQGFTVFMISWVNPDQNHRHIGFDDYLQMGILSAVDTIQKLTGEKSVNAVGYCLGGILLATAMAYLSHHKQNHIATATYLATSIDYKDPGDISIFCNEKTIKSLEDMMDKDGFLDGRFLSVSFNLLRENELYWNYYIQNYLKGEQPKAFDILHWNSDNTNIPAKTHSFVLRDLHLNNGLVEKDSIKLLDTPINLKKVTNPTYILATDKDHIAKWESAYSATQLHSGESRFVLAGSGHIAGVINPPSSNKYYYHINADLPKSPKSWLKQATKTDGSWWNDWIEWLQPHGGDRIKARRIPAKHVLENAPGRYALKRLV